MLEPWQQEAIRSAPIHNGKLCSCCTEWIEVMGKFIYLDGAYYHVDCLADNYTTSELLELFGIEEEEEREQ